MKKVILYKDLDNEIVLSKDHYHGVVVQVVRYIDSMQQTADGQLSNVIAPKVIHQKIIKIVQKTLPAFRQEVQEAITECHGVLNNIKAIDQQLNGLLNDYFSANRELNEPKQQ